jgi:hypothetical protein
MPGTGRTRQATVIIIPERPYQARPGPGSPEPAARKPQLLTVLLSLLALLALLHFIASLHAARPGVVPVNCLGLLRSTDYSRVVHLQPRQQELGSVQVTDQLIGGQTTALVEVTTSAARPSVDVYLFGCSMQGQTPSLLPLFAQRGLIGGAAFISPANTLITSQTDTSLSPQTLALEQPLQQNVYREYRWRHNHFEQVAFPGLYPVSSRSEAEALQQQADHGQELPWSDPLATAEQMARDIFRWTTIGSGDAVLQENGSFARVRLAQENPQMRVEVTLERLLRPDKQGLWFVTGAQSGGLAPEQPPPQASPASVITSPAAIVGSGALVNGQTTATLFDHTLTPLSLLNNPNLQVDQHGTYSGMLFYKQSIPQQPGLLLIQSLPASSGEEGRLLLLRVILA